MKLYVTDELKRFENGLVFAWESLLKNIMGYYYLDDLSCITNGKQNVIVEDSITGIKETFSRLNGLENTYIDLLNKRNDFEIKDHLNSMNNITFDLISRIDKNIDEVRNDNKVESVLITERTLRDLIQLKTKIEDFRKRVGL